MVDAVDIRRLLASVLPLGRSDLVLSLLSLSSPPIPAFLSVQMLPVLSCNGGGSKGADDGGGGDGSEFSAGVAPPLLE